LAFGDPVASYVGVRFGRNKLIGHKSLQGSIAAFMVCTVITYTFLARKDLMTDRIWVISIMGGLIGALSELIPIADLDDNLTLPILSATGLWLIFWIFDA
jgi:dolichol kinase